MDRAGDEQNRCKFFQTQDKPLAYALYEKNPHFFAIFQDQLQMAKKENYSKSPEIVMEEAPTEPQLREEHNVEAIVKRRKYSLDRN